MPRPVGVTDVSMFFLPKAEPSAYLDERWDGGYTSNSTETADFDDITGVRDDGRLGVLRRKDGNRIS